MNATEYENLRRVEREHWYYAGKRELVTWWLRRHGQFAPDRTLLDCGAGTGCFARELSRELTVRVLDNHPESLALLRGTFPADRVLEGVCTRLPVPTGSQDFVTALDVLEHLADDAAAVGEFRRALRPGGLIGITVPASPALWSNWDVALHHYRRYRRRTLLALFPSDAWDILHVNYTNAAAYPFVWYIRRCRSRARSTTAGRLEDRIPPPALNKLLRALFVASGRCRVPLPFGVSLVLIARRR